MIKKDIFKKFLFLVVLVLSCVFLISCKTEETTDGVWNKFVEAFNSKDLQKLGEVYYSNQSAIDTWKEDLDESYFDNTTIATKSYEQTSVSDFSTEVKVEKYFSAKVVCDLTNDDGKFEKTFDVFYLKNDKGIFFDSEVNLRMVTDSDIEVIDAEVASINNNELAAIDAEIQAKEAERDEKIAEVNKTVTEIDNRMNEIDVLLTEIDEQLEYEEDEDRINELISQMEELVAELELLGDKITEELDKAAPLEAEIQMEYDDIIMKITDKKNPYLEKIEELENEKAHLEKLQSDGVCQIPTNNWIAKAYYQNENYIYQRVFDVEQIEVDEELIETSTYAISLSSQLTNQKEVVIPSQIDGYDVIAIDDYAFYRISRLLTFTVKSSKLQKVTLPETLETIGKSAFYQCGKLKEIEIPNSVKTIGSNAFASCVNMKKVIINVNDNSLYYDENGVSTKVEAVSVPTKVGSTEANVTITGAYTSVYQGDIIKLTVDCPDINPQDIKWEATQGAEYVTIEKTDSYNVVNVVISNNNVVMGADEFKNITIKASDKNRSNESATVTFEMRGTPTMKTIDATAFDRCNGLEEMYIYALNPYSIKLGTKFSLSSNVIIYVPKGCAKNYKSSFYWSSYAAQIKEME